MTGLADFHHIEFFVSNALQASYYYCCILGFERFAELKNGPETSIAVRNGKAIFIFTSNFSAQNQLLIHGDAVRDVAFRVDDLSGLLKELASHNLPLFQEPEILFDEFGSVQIAKLRSQETDIIHSLINLKDYSGIFLPGFKECRNFPIGSLLSSLKVKLVDHVVQNYPIDFIETAAEWYRKTLQMNRFWSIDDKITTSEFSAMKAWLITNPDQKVQVTLAESVKGRKGRSQIQEFVDFNGGPGIQHIALLVDDIVEAVGEMKKRSVEFLTVPSVYYDLLRDRIAAKNLDFDGDIEKLRELSILMDFDANGYLLQIFTKPMQDRPTLFIEIIQRRNFNGFGAGNFKALFDAIEREQQVRGTLCNES